MHKIKNNSDLKFLITQLELSQATAHFELKEQGKITYEELKPLNFLKNKLKEISVNDDFKDSLLVTTVGLTAGYASKALLVGESKSPIKKLLGTLVQLGVSHVISKNPQVVKLLSNNILDFINKKKESQSEKENSDDQ